MMEIGNHYEGNQTALNLMGAGGYRNAVLTGSDIAIILIPVILTAVILIAAFMPDLQFMAQCSNIPGGDVCVLSLI